MNARICRFLRAASLTGIFALAACNADRTHDALADTVTGGTTESLLDDASYKAIDEARDDVRSRNISLSESTQGAPKVEITPQGDLLINSVPIATTSGQNALLLDYRTRLIEVAESGMGIGTQGTELAGKAKTEMERALLADAARIEAAAAELCSRLPALLASERRLAAALPEFAPYAQMDDGDIDDCMDDHDRGATDAQRAQRRDETRGSIRNGVRGSIQQVTQSVGPASRDDTDASNSEVPGAPATE